MVLKKITGSIGGLITGALLIGSLFAGAKLYSSEAPLSDADSAYEHMALFTRVVEFIRQHYVDEERVHYGDLMRAALQGMLQSLDEHSYFMEPEEYSDMKDDTEGHFGGLGIHITLRENILTIVTPMEGTPAFDAGLSAGDRIIEIEDESTEGISLQEAVRKLRGAPGTRVRIKIHRPEPEEIKEVEIVRGDINISSVKSACMLRDAIGYIRITQFIEPTEQSLQEDIAELKEKGMQGLVLDLRNNPGGLLSSAVDVSSLFLPRRALIVYTEGRLEGDREEYRSRNKNIFNDISLVILVNGGSASASEIVAGALRDHKRAVLVGEKTFGKGSVQSILPVSDGAALRLTTAKYYTPSRQVIHGKGLQPDVEITLSARRWQQILTERGALENDPDGGICHALQSVDDPQLAGAVDILTGIMIYNNRNTKTF